MRSAIVGALFICLPFPMSAFAAPAMVADNPVVMPDTPSGMGDPNLIVCRAPQRFADSDRFGPKSCGYNYEWWQLTSRGKDLAPDGKTVIDRRTVANPKGVGDPDAVTCRTPRDIGGESMRIRHYGPEVCQTNQFWADLIKNRKTLDAAGLVVPATPAGMPSFTGSSAYVDQRAQYYVGSR